MGSLHDEFNAETDTPTPMKLLRRLVRSAIVLVEEVIRLLAMLLILTPASVLLPRSIALKCADLVAWILMLLPNI